MARARDVVIDLADVTFIDAAGVAFLQTLRNRVATRDGVVWLHDSSPLVRRILDVAPIDGVLTCTSAGHRSELDGAKSPTVGGGGGGGPIDRSAVLRAMF